MSYGSRMADTQFRSVLRLPSGPRVRALGRGLLAAWIVAGSGCRTTPPEALTADARLIGYAAAGRRARDDGAPDKAAGQYRLALERARALDDAAALAVMGQNLGACLIESGRAAEAESVLGEARAAARRAGKSESGLVLLQGRAALAAGRPKDAVRLAGEAVAGEAPPRGLRAGAALLRAEAHAALGDRGAAGTALAEAAQGIRADSPPAMRARLAAVEGWAALEDGDPAAAANALEGEAAAWREAGAAGHVAAALARAADAAAQAADSPRAARLHYRSAAAWSGGGDFPRAQTQIRRARERMPAADEALRALLDALQGELDRAAAAK